MWSLSKKNMLDCQHEYIFRSFLATKRLWLKLTYLRNHHNWNGCIFREVYYQLDSNKNEKMGGWRPAIIFHPVVCRMFEGFGTPLNYLHTENYITWQWKSLMENPCVAVMASRFWKRRLSQVNKGVPNKRTRLTWTHQADMNHEIHWNTD